MNHKFSNTCLFVVLLCWTSVAMQAQPNPTYSINWVNQIGVSTNGGVLTKTSPTGTWSNAGAISSNLLVSNTDGWMEFSAVNGANFRIGLAVNNILGHGQFSNSIFIDSNTGNAIAFEGETSTLLSNFQTGDVFRISREVGWVKYYKNGIALRTVAANPSLELKVKACIYITGRSTPNITTSFDCRLIVLGSVVGLEGNSGSGSITLNVLGGTLPYTFNWSSGEKTSSVSNKPRGTYTVAVTDGLGRTQNRTYNIGYKVNWINPAGVSINGSILTKTAQEQSWNSGAISSNIFPANTDGWMEFSGVNGANFRIGLATNNILSYSQFSNSIFIDSNTGSAIAFEGGTSASLGNFQTGDIFRISREGSMVKYYKNAEAPRTITVNPSFVLKVKACIYITGYSVPSILDNRRCHSYLLCHCQW